MIDNELLSALSNIIEPLRNDIKGVHERLDKMDQRFDKVDERLDKMDQRLDNLDEHTALMQIQLNTVDDRLSIVDKRTVQTQLFLENEISQKIDIIGEGHDFLKDRLDTALTTEKKREAMELRIINSEMRISRLEQSLNDCKSAIQKIS